ncbi:MAG: murein biosynthesis integral membrane protein MurJ, partial [Candidatus Levybacteria bacterium CG_4_9_14_3_um_filter_36_7]
MVTDLFKKSINAFTSKQTNIFSAASFIILTTILSQVLGLLKYRLLVSLFGASSALGVFFAAFRIPDFIFQIVIAGALSSSFIPIFSDYLSRDKKKEAFSLTSSLITIGLVSFVVVTIVMIIFSYQLVSLVAPGFSKDELVLMSRLMIIIQLSQLFFILGTVATAILQSFQHFLIPGIASAFYNAGIILGLIIFTSFFGLGIYGATVGVLIGSVLFFLIQLPLLASSGFSFKPSFNMKNGVEKILHLMVPRSATLILSQIAITANVFFASFVSARGLVIFDLAQTLVMAPVLLFGQSIAQASFPALSFKVGDKKEFVSIFTYSFNQILYLTLPISALLIVLRVPVVRLFFGASRFDWSATVDTGLTLAYFSISISAIAIMYLVSRAFYALKDAKTPFIVTSISVSINIFTSYLFILCYHFPIYSLAFSFSIANLVSIVVMLLLLDRKVNLPRLDILLTLTKILIATVIMGVALYVPIKLLDQLVFDTTRTINLLILT